MSARQRNHVIMLVVAVLFVIFMTINRGGSSSDNYSIDVAAPFDTDVSVSTVIDMMQLPNDAKRRHRISNQRTRSATADSELLKSAEAWAKPIVARRSAAEADGTGLLVDRVSPAAIDRSPLSRLAVAGSLSAGSLQTASEEGGPRMVILTSDRLTVSNCRAVDSEVGMARDADGMLLRAEDVPLEDLFGSSLMADEFFESSTVATLRSSRTIRSSASANESRSRDRLVLLQACVSMKDDDSTPTTATQRRSVGSFGERAKAVLGAEVQVLVHRYHNPYTVSFASLRSGQAVIYAADNFLSMYLSLASSSSFILHIPVVMLHAEEVSMCESVFDYFWQSRENESIELVTFREETPSLADKGARWYDRSSAFALSFGLGGGDQPPIPLLMGQPRSGDFLMGASTTRMFAYFLRSLRSTIRERNMMHTSPVTPAIIYTAALYHYSNVHSISRASVAHRTDGSKAGHDQVATFSDLNEDICKHLQLSTASRGRPYTAREICDAARSVVKKRIVFVFESQDCQPLPALFEDDAAQQEQGREQPAAAAAEARKTNAAEKKRIRCDFIIPSDAVAMQPGRADADEKNERMEMIHRLRDGGLRNFFLNFDPSTFYHGNLNRNSYQSLLPSSTCPGRSPDAMIAFATGYRERTVIAPLLNSFTRHHREGCSKLVLFVSRGSLDVFSHEHPDVVVVNADEVRERAGTSLLTRRCKLNKQRKELIYLWLLNTGMPTFAFRYILMLDSRDLLLQRDPFGFLESLHAGVVAPLVSDNTAEDGGESTQRNASLSSSSFIVFPPEASLFSEIDWRFRGGFIYNKMWAEVAFGNAFASWMIANATVPIAYALSFDDLPTNSSRFGTSPPSAPRKLAGTSFGRTPLTITCGGVYGGTAAAFLDFVKLMYRAMNFKPDKRDCYNDQGMMNGLVAAGLHAASFPHDVIITNPETTMFTHRFGRGKLSWVSQAGRRWQALGNCQGEAYAVVHQTDRFPRVWSHLLQDNASYFANS